jgi:hypothetical protein
MRVEGPQIHTRVLCAPLIQEFSDCGISKMFGGFPGGFSKAVPMYSLKSD